MWWKCSVLVILAGKLLSAHAVPNHLRITSAAVQYMFDSLSQEEQKQLADCLSYIEQLLLVGTRREDTDEGNRFMFHFSPELHSDIYNFLTLSQGGAGPFVGTHVDAYCDSLQWGLASADVVPCVHNQPMDANYRRFIDTTRYNEHTWQSALEDGRSSDVVVRQRGWRHLGYVLHLLQDLTSPAHVRTDAHPHVSIWHDIHIGDADPLEFDAERIPRTPRPSQLPLYVTHDEHFEQLRDWTRQRFYSRHTVGSDPGPKAVSLSEDGYWMDNESRRIAYRANKGILGGKPINPLDLSGGTIDAEVANEQWDELSPVVVKYTASLIYVYWKAVQQLTPCESRGDARVTCLSFSAEVTRVGGTTTNEVFQQVKVKDRLSGSYVFRPDFAFKYYWQYPSAGASYVPSPGLYFFTPEDGQLFLTVGGSEWQNVDTNLEVKVDRVRVSSTEEASTFSASTNLWRPGLVVPPDQNRFVVAFLELKGSLGLFDSFDIPLNLPPASLFGLQKTLSLRSGFRFIDAEVQETGTCVSRDGPF